MSITFGAILDGRPAPEEITLTRPNSEPITYELAAGSDTCIFFERELDNTCDNPKTECVRVCRKCMKIIEVYTYHYYDPVYDPLQHSICSCNSNN